MKENEHSLFGVENNTIFIFFKGLVFFLLQQLEQKTGMASKMGL